MSCASTSTYPQNLGSVGLLIAELRGRVCLFLFVGFCPSRYDSRHRKPRRCVYALKLGGTGISPQDKSPPGQQTPPTGQKPPPLTKALPDKNPPAKSPPGQKCPRTKKTGSGHPTSGDIFYCSGSRQLNHSSSCYVAAKATCIRLLHVKIGFLVGFFGPCSVKRGRTHIVLG